MSETPSRPLFQLTEAELREIVRQELKSGATPAVEERLLDVKEAARLLSCEPDWLYHNRKTLPFARKLGHKMLRFSYRGLLKWAESKKFGA